MSEQVEQADVQPDTYASDTVPEKPLRLPDGWTNTPELQALLKDFNDEQGFYVVHNFGSRVMICWEAPDANFPGVSTPVLHRLPVYDFGLSHMNQLIRVGGTDEEPILKTKSEAWLRHPLRREYEQVLFAPGQDLGPNYRNLWRGFSYVPMQGDCSLYLTHLKDNICRGNATKYQYLINWMAYHVHHPGEQGQVAIVVFGAKGVGKNVFAEGFSRLWGPHGMVVNDSQRVTGHFNNHLRDKCVLIADEAFFAGSHSDERRLKTLITGNTITVEAKGVDVVSVPNLLRIIIIGNDPHIIRASKDERRYLVMECGDAKRKNYTYFQAITDQLNQGGYQALLYHLLYEVDLTNFNVREAPRTEELIKQMRESQTGAAAIWYECLCVGRIPGQVETDGTARLTLSELLEWARLKRRDEARWVNVTHLGNLFGTTKGLGYRCAKLGPRGNQRRKLVIPTLKTAREDFDRSHFDGDWHNDEANWKAEEWELCNDFMAP